MSKPGTPSSTGAVPVPSPTICPCCGQVQPSPNAVPPLDHPEHNIQVLHVPNWMVNDSQEMPYAWADGPEREEIMDAFVA